MATSGDITRNPDKQSTSPLINHKNEDRQKDTKAMSETEKFLDYYKSARSKGTYKSYKRGLTLFEEYYGKDTDNTLEERRQDIASGDFVRSQRFVREIEKFHSWLLDRSYSINTARTMTLGIMQLFRFYARAENELLYSRNCFLDLDIFYHSTCYHAKPF